LNYYTRLYDKARHGDQDAIAKLKKQRRTVPSPDEMQSKSEDPGRSSPASSSKKDTESLAPASSNHEVHSSIDDQQSAPALSLEGSVPIPGNSLHLEVARALLSDVYSLMGKSFDDTAGERDRLDQFRDRHKWMEPGTAYILDQLDYQELFCLFEEPWLSDAIAMDPCSSEANT
jgi:hypothetical protein